MGKHKTQRTDELQQTVKNYLIAEQAQNHIEQHNFDRLVRNGALVEGVASAECEKTTPGGGV